MNSRMERICLLAAFGLPLAVYFYTAAPVVFWEDSAIFSTAAATLGIPHSPGFPLWVLLAKLFTWLVPHNPARATNMMSGFFGAVAAAFYYLCALSILTRLNPTTSESESKAPFFSRSAIALTSLGSAFLFSFTLSVWLQGVRAEVYSLQLVLMLGLLFLALTLEQSEYPTRLLLSGAFLWGLSAAVHPLLSVAVLPGFLILGCFASPGWKKEFAKWGWALGFVFLAATIYFFLPLRSIHDPYLNWNQPDTWARFLSVITRKDDWSLSLSDTPSHLAYSQVMRLAAFLSSEYSSVIWIFAAVGVLALARQRPRAGLGIFVLLLSIFFVTLWAAEFNPRNLDTLGYLSFGMGTAALCATAGLAVALPRVAGWLPRWSRAFPWAAPVATAVVAAWFLAGKNWAKANLHNSTWAQEMAVRTLNSLPPHSVVMFSSDQIMTPFWYAQGALGLRPDVAIVMSDVFGRPLLAEQTRRRNPDLPIDPKAPFPYKLSGIRAGFQKFCRENRRPLFCEFGNHVTRWRHFWPAGYLLEYRESRADSTVTPQVVRFIDSTFSGQPDFSSREIIGIEMYNWAAYLSKLGAPENGRLLFQAARFDHENPRMWRDVGKAYLFSRRFSLAENCFKLALAYDPYWGENYLFLAFVLQAQGKAEEAKEALAEGNFWVPDKLRGLDEIKKSR